MDDLTKIKGIGKASAKKLIAAGYSTYAALAGATGAADLAKLQDAGFATVEIDAWVMAAAELVAADTSSEGGKDRQSEPASAPAPADAGASPSGEAASPAAPDAPGGSEVPQATISLFVDEPKLVISSDSPASDGTGGGGDPATPAELPGHEAWLVFQDLDRAEAEGRFPLLLAALQAWVAAAGGVAALHDGPTVRIAAKRDGFRRAGVAHAREAVDYPARRWMPEELEALLAEPNLRVELV